MNRSRHLLPLGEVTERLRLTGRAYLGVCSIPLAKIIGSVDRACEFDRDFHPQRHDSESRMRALRTAFPDGDFPAISVFEVGGAYFISDGHHRAALAHERGQEFIEAEVVRLATNYRLPPDVDIPQLVHTELRRMFMEESGLELVRPDIDISFSSPAGYLELLEAVKAHGWDLAARLGRLPRREELAQSWLTEVYEPGMRVLQETELSCPERDATSADSFLWLYQRRRALWCGERAQATATRSTTFAILVGCRGGNVVRCGRRLTACPQRKPRSWPLSDRPQAASLRAIEVWATSVYLWLPFPADGRRHCLNST